MLELKIAFRDLTRQPVRTGIAVSAIFFGVLALLLSSGFIEWIFWAMREATVYSTLGHIQIARAGYFSQGQDDFSTYLLPEDAPEFAQIATTQLIRLVTPRLTFNGLVSRGETTTSFIGEGVDPERESQISHLLHITKGKELSSDDPKGIILGQGLAEAIGVSVGDPIILLVNTPSGGINAVEGHVRGLFFTVSKQFDDSALRLPIALARELLRVAGAHVWVALLDETERTEIVTTQIKQQMLDRKSDLAVRPWYELADYYNKTVTLYSRQMFVVELIIALIIVLSIANTMTMNILERTGEIGTMMAMGNRSKQIMRLFITEGLVLGLVGGAAGCLVGYTLALIISHIGIPMPPAPGMTTGFTGQIRVTAGLLAQAFFTAVFTSVAASIYPAWKGSRLNIVNALRHNR